jgi:thiol-disulfide isomerase/thioredoxin
MAVNLVIVAAILIAATAFGLVRKRSDGRVRVPRAGGDPLARRLHADDLGGTTLGRRATFLQFSSEMCQPCRATARVLTEVSTQEDGVAHVELDAEQHLDLVRRLGVLRTPTVFVLDRHGTVTGRAAGAMRKAEALTALAAVEAAV